MTIQSSTQTASNVAELAKNVDAFGQSVNWWNNAYIILLGLTFIASAIIAFRNNALSRAQKQLSEAKDALVAETNLRTAKLEQETTISRGEVANLQIVVAEAERKRAEAERELLELQQRLGPRSITSEQKSKFIDFLKDTVKGKVKLSALAQGDTEPVAFAQVLKSLLSDAGYAVDDTIEDFISSGSPVSGIVVKIRGEKAPPPHAAPIQAAFKQIGISVSAATEDPVFNLDADTVIIYVYGKN